MRFARSFGTLLVTALALSACRKHETPQADTTGATPEPAELPPLELRDDTPNLLLTWIDDKGDFHVVQKPADVPKDSRDQVRVVVTTREDGTGKLVYVANLNEVTATGAYRVKTMPRSAWDELGASKRTARLEALAPSAVPAPSGSTPEAVASAAKKAAASGITAIIYGASWCKPCHDTARYLKQRGVTVIDKDIDENEVANAEMRQKLARAGRSGSSIPVIDLMGQILIGFSPSALDQAIDAARAAKPL
ncbi:MAG TPA: glutaredoxin domain-containing protein [Polyangiaceae bacterium]